MNRAYNKAEKEHLTAIKSMSCSVCGASGPSDAHHIRQNSAFFCIPLCKDCHQGPVNGIHGRKAMWKIHKMDEWDALANLIKGIYESRPD